MPLRVVNIYPETISDGFGIRFSIYLAGCGHHCLGCHNPQSWDHTQGELLSLILPKILKLIKANPLLDGITLSGGDPFYKPKEIISLLKTLKAETGLNIWCYSGYTYEELLVDKERKEALNYIDVLVDGRFVLAEKDPTLYFRGSRNQRILYLKDGKIDFVRFPELEYKEEDE